MVNESEKKDYGIDECQSTSELPENKLRHNFRLGDITWVKQSGSSWWPAQVIDESCVGGKPKKKAKHDCLVRLYGTCQYLYVDPWKSNTEFKMMLKQENKSPMEAFREVLEKVLSRVNSSSDYDEESVNSKGGDTEVTTVKASSRKVRKRESLDQCSYRGVKKAVAAENLGDETEQQYIEEQDQEVESTTRTGVTVRNGKRGRTRQSCSTHDKEQAIDKASSEDSAEGLRDKRQKKVANVLDKEGYKIGGSVVRREGSRRSSRSNAKEYLDASEDITASLTDTRASEDATEDSMVDGIPAPHGEIKAMVRDILFKDIIDREHDAEMAFVDEVINGICNATEDNMTGGATASTNGGHRKGKLDQATEDTTQVSSPETMNHTTKNGSSLNEIIDTTPSRDAAAMKEPGQLSARQIRQIRIMQSLGLIAPSGSPFGKNEAVAATQQ